MMELGTHLIADICNRLKIGLTEMEARYAAIRPFHRTAIAENRSAEMPDVQSRDVLMHIAPAGRDQRTFTCPVCEYSESIVVKFD
jgi:hypothetical protein